MRKQEKGGDKGVKIKRCVEDGACCSKSLSGSAEWRPCPDLWCLLGNKRMDWILFNHPLHSIVAPAANMRATCSTMIYRLCDLLQYADHLTHIDLQWTHTVRCRSVAPVCSPQTRFCQLYQMIVCCHGDRNGAGSGLIFRRERERETGRQTVFKDVHVQRSTY